MVFVNRSRHGVGNVAAFFVFMLTTMSTYAAEHNYEIKVQGMKCAYCAYSVSKNLAAIDGIITESVRIDLERGVATLQSVRPLDDHQIEQSFLDSGFLVADITRHAQLPERGTPSARIASISIGKEQIGSTIANQLLDVLGETAAARSSKLHVRAPQTLEQEILRPLIAGRQRAIQVRYEPADDDTIEVTLYQ